MNAIAAGLLALVALSAGAARAVAAPHEFDEPEIVTWWPSYLPSASRLYQCALASRPQGRNSVVVWTNGQRQVLALGAAIAGGELPPYVLAMVNPAHGRADDPIRVALHGYLVKTVTVKGRESRASLQIAGTALNCFATSDD